MKKLTDNVNIPFLQGEHDGLCGLYAIANAMKYNSDKVHSPSYYKYLFSKVNVDLFQNGIEHNDYMKVMADCSKHYSFLYKQIKNTTVSRLSPLSGCFIVGVGKSDVLWDEPHYTIIIPSGPEYYTFYDCYYGLFLAKRELFSFKSEKNKVRIYQDEIIHIC